MIQNEPFSCSIITGVLGRTEVEYVILQRRIGTCFRTGSIGASFRFGALLVGGIGLPIMASATSTTSSCGMPSHLARELLQRSIEVFLFLLESCALSSSSWRSRAAAALYRVLLLVAFACRSVSVKRTSLD